MRTSRKPQQPNLGPVMEWSSHAPARQRSGKSPRGILEVLRHHRCYWAPLRPTVMPCDPDRTCGEPRRTVFPFAQSAAGIQPRTPAVIMARVVRSGPNLSAPSMASSSNSRVRARLTRLLIVPTAVSQMAAASA
jgi:hypothetical protein